MGILGCGKIGFCFAKITNGFGMRNIVYDVIKLEDRILKEMNAI